MMRWNVAKKTAKVVAIALVPTTFWSAQAMAQPMLNADITNMPHKAGFKVTAQGVTDTTSGAHTKITHIAYNSRQDAWHVTFPAIDFRAGDHVAIKSGGKMLYFTVKSTYRKSCILVYGGASAPAGQPKGSRK